LAFLKVHRLDKDFIVSIEVNHATLAGHTLDFELMQTMMQIIRNGGLGISGTNFDAKTRRKSTDLKDIFIVHVAGMDAMACALENAELC